MIIVSVHVLYFSYFSFFSFFSLGQSGYVSLQWREGTWSSKTRTRQGQDMTGTKQAQDRTFRGLKKFSGGGGGGGWWVVEKVIIVSVHVRYFSFFSLCQTGYVRLHQVTSGYIRLRHFTLEGRDVELDNLMLLKSPTYNPI